MSFIENRLRRLEEGGRCPECGLAPGEHGRMAVIDDEHPEKSFDGDPNERCTRCGQPLYVVMRIVYDDDEGEGDTS